MILARGDRIGVADLPAALAATPGPAVELGGRATLDEIEREHIARVISHTTSFEAAAKILGIDATTLQRKRKRYGFD